MSGLVEALVGMRADLDMLKVAFGNSMKVGPVAEVDAAKGYRLKLSGDGYLSPWYPHPESGKSSIPLKPGDIVGVVHPSGDPRQGLMFRAGYSGPRPSPNSDMSANVFEDAGVRVTIADNALVVEVGSTTVTIAADGIRMVSDRIDLN